MRKISVMGERYYDRFDVIKNRTATGPLKDAISFIRISKLWNVVTIMKTIVPVFFDFYTSQLYSWE